MQFAILLGGGEILCDTIVERWQKDTEAYQDFKIYLESDLAFFLQVLENDTCFINATYASSQPLLIESGQDSLRQSIHHKIQKLIINYLHITGGLSKAKIIEQVSSHLHPIVLKDPKVFDDALAEVSNEIKNETGEFQYQLKSEVNNKFFHSLFSRDLPCLFKLLEKIIVVQQSLGRFVENDLHTESQLQEEDEPLQYLQQVRRCLIENVKLHTVFRQIFIERSEIMIAKIRTVCRILSYIFDVIEEGILDSRASKKLSNQSTKSLLIQYVFDPVIAERIDHLGTLQDEDGISLVDGFQATLNNIIYRREAIKILLKDIFSGVKISEIIV